MRNDGDSMNKLDIIAIEVTEGCNLNCSFCARDASNIKFENIKVEKYKIFLDLLTELEKPPAIAFTGGEPLMHPEFKILIEETIKRKLKFSITTNGTIINEDILEICKNTNYFKHFIVSIDSCNKEIHNQIRGNSNAYQKTMQFLKKIKLEHIDFCINMTVDVQNYKDVSETIKFAKEIGAKDISVATVKPSGRGESTLNQNELDYIAKQIIKNQNLIDDKFKLWATEVTFFLYDIQNYLDEIENGNFGSCSFGKHTLHICMNGDIQGCATCDLILGNVYSEKFNFAKFWECNEVLNRVRNKDNLSGECKKCKYVQFCGGCRCRAYALTGDLLGDDLYCPLIEKVIV